MPALTKVTIFITDEIENTIPHVLLRRGICEDNLIDSASTTDGLPVGMLHTKHFTVSCWSYSSFFSLIYYRLEYLAEICD